jgi:hypothetical protein
MHMVITQIKSPRSLLTTSTASIQFYLAILQWGRALHVKITCYLDMFVLHLNFEIVGSRGIPNIIRQLCTIQ